MNSYMRISRFYIGLIIIVLIVQVAGSIVFGQPFKAKGYIINPILQFGQFDTIIRRPLFLHQPDTIHHRFIKNGTKADPNFSYKKYVEFLTKISDTSKYIVLSIDEFRKKVDPKKIVIGLRHDVDLDLNIAKDLATVENNFGFTSTYYILHTASYYLASSNNMAIHSEAIIPTLKLMQNDYHHEIGWHNDLVTLQLVYKIDNIAFFHQELNWLREKGINIYGSASHGSNYCYDYKYLNYYFFEECKNPPVGQFVNNEFAMVNGVNVKLNHGHLSDFGLNYEAYFLNNNKYFSDASFVNGLRWNTSMLDLHTLKPGDRVIILLHPIYYYSYGSSIADITAFSMPGQLGAVINPTSSTILVEMPNGMNTENLSMTFSLSTGARARFGLNELESGLGSYDFTLPKKIKVVAENGLNFKIWTVTVAKSSSNVSLSANNLSIGGTANSKTSFDISSNTSWSISSNKDWITSDVTSGENNKTVTLTAQENTGAISRQAIITIEGVGYVPLTITVTQDAAPTLSISSSMVSIASVVNSSANFDIFSNTNWSIICDSDWLTTNITNGNYNQRITITAQENPTISSRQAIITVNCNGLASQSISVIQEPTALLLSSKTLSIKAEANSTISFDIKSITSWSINSNSSWIKSNFSSGINNSTITLTAQENPTTTSRQAEFTISGDGFSSQSLSVIQEPSPAKLNVSTNMLSIGSSANSKAVFEIASNTNWYLSSSELWLIPDVLSGNSNKLVTLVAQPNLGSTTRLATISINAEGVDSKSISVSQESITSGIEEIANSQISIYPNPAQTTLFIHGATHNTKVTIVDMWGKILIYKKLSSNSIDIGKLTKGFYTIRIVDKNRVETKKFVKE